MANTQHVAKLRQGVDAWNRWREQDWNVKPDLSGLDLANEKGLKNTPLWDETTKRVSIATANLSWANLKGANLSGANLEEVNLSEADLSGATLRATNLSGANLESALLTGAELVEAQLIRAALPSADLSGADLRSASFSGANLQLANLAEADLRSAQLNTAILVGANLKKADLWVANLNGANLSGANLEEANLIRSELHHADLSGAVLYGADLREANLEAANLDHAGVIGIRYERRFMRGKYHGIRGVETTYSDAIFRRDALDQDYIDTLTLRWRRSPMILVLWLWSLIDYGRGLFRALWIALLAIVGFGFAFAINPGVVAFNAGVENWFTPYYGSLITFTTLGFADAVVAQTLAGQLLLSAEVILGYFTVAVLLSILLQKLARRS